MTRPVSDTSVRYALRKSAKIGLVLGAGAVVLMLLVDNDSIIEVVVWGGSLLVGVLGTAAGLVFAGMARLVAGSERRALGERHTRELFMPEVVGLERSFLYFAVPLLITGLLLSVSLLLQGESLF